MSEEKIGLQGGYCGGRHTCKNLNKKCCNPKPESNQNYVKCSHYEPKKEDFRIMSDEQIQNLVKEKVKIEREKVIEHLKDLIDKRETARQDNDIYMKTQYEVNENCIEELKSLIKMLER